MKYYRPGTRPGMTLRGSLARRKAGRKPRPTGIPNGWKKENFFEAINDQREKSRQIVRRTFMAEELNEDPRVEDVLTELHTIASAQYTIDPLTGERVKVKHGDPLGFTYPTNNRIAAAKIFLDFKKAKPAQKIDANVTNAEDLWASLAAEENKDGEAEQGDSTETS